MTVTVHPGDLSFQELRLERSVARRKLELAQMRLPAHDKAAEATLQPLRDLVRALTDELIARYARDLALVDLLLDAPYPADGGRSRSVSTPAAEVTP